MSIINIRTKYLERVFEVLLVVGYIFFIFVASYIRGPIYALFYFEGGYVALFNGVSFLTGEPIHFVVHSLPLTEIGAFISLALYVLQGGFSLTESVAHNAETFSIALDIVIYIFVGWGLLRFYRRLVNLFGFLSGIMGLLPLLALPASIYIFLLHVNPDLFALGCAFWSLEFCLRTEDNQLAKSKTQNAALAGIFAAVGLATKIVFLPVLLVAFVMAPRRISFMLGFVFTLMVLYFPILDEEVWSLLPYFTYFVSGEAASVDKQFESIGVIKGGLASWLRGFPYLVHHIPFYVGMIGIISILGAVRWKAISNTVAQGKWLFVGLVGGLFALALVAIRPSPWYLVPSFPILGIALAICFSRKNLPPQKYPVLWGLAGGLWVFAAVWFADSSYYAWNFFNNLKSRTRAEFGLIESRSHCAVILQIGSAHPLSAIFHGMNYTGGVLWGKMGPYVIPERYYWHWWENPEELLNHVGNRIPASRVLENYDCAFVVGMPLQDGLRPDFVPKPHTFSVETYCSLAGPTFGYNCNLPSIYGNYSLGYVISHGAKPSVSVLSAPQSTVNTILSDFLTDADMNTFWETNVSGTTVIDLKINPATYTNSYSLAVGGHDSAAVLIVPKSWRLYARNVGEKWTILDSISDTKDWSLNEQRRFELDTKKAYSEFRFEFDPLPNQKAIRIYEISFGFEDNVRQMQHPDENLKVD